MKISFHGACREVTGSCIMVETEDTKFIVDCGLFQDNESKFKNSVFSGFDPLDIDFVLLTHAHIDHCGRIPKLYKEGFRGNIYCSEPTIELANQMMLDSAKVFMARESMTPIYFLSDVEDVMSCFTSVPYGQEFSINKNVRIRLNDAGHVLGSAIFEVWIKEGKEEKKLVFSGDLGNPPTPILKDTEFIEGADYVFVESTYGTKTHIPRKEGIARLKEKIVEIIGKQGVIMLPVFALERTQEMIVELKSIFEKGDVKDIPVFLDSPLALRVTNIYKRYQNYFDKKKKKGLNKKEDLFYFNNFKIAKKKGDQKKFLRIPGPKIVMAGSGMCDGGRIVDYLKKYLSKKENELLIISFQAENSLGRQLADGAKDIKIGDKRIKVRANVSKIQAFSSHADHPKIMSWIKKIKNPLPQGVFVVHGEEESSLGLADSISNELKLNAIVPNYNEDYEI